ncbi:MAG: GTP 3',8-cyclase MoaA [Desulfobacterales bacterium]|jgi:cyclic pyranopterin phosphate synthase|nr:GTP 3',8-cyclase MoaA [Desulfobacterales bacterium]
MEIQTVKDAKLIDNCNRHLNYLRISITDRCNLQCRYCVPHDLVPKLSYGEILTYEEILRVVRIATRLGISKVRVTGGEPLVRKGVYDFLKALVATEGLKDVSLTTNGVLLKDNLLKIQSAGIARINVSLDTLNRKKYREITGYDDFDRVWQGIEKAHDMGFYPIKLNIVALKGVNDDEFVEMARLSFRYPFHVRFIEYMPIGQSDFSAGSLLLAPEIKDRIRAIGNLVPVQGVQHDGPAQRYKFEDAKGEVGFIPALSQHFCNKCNRLRLTASGHLRPCLLADHQEDLKDLLRKGCSDQELANIFFMAIRHKPSDHNLASQNPTRVCSQMRAIGG